MMSSILFFFYCLVLMYFEYKREKKIINVISLLVLPYSIIIPVNNILMKNFGFNIISNSVLFMLSIAFFLFFVGSRIVKKKNVDNEISKDITFEKKISKYNMENMYKYITFVIIVTLIRLLYVIFTNGLVFLSSDEFSGLLFSGVFGHLFVSIYPLIPLMFYYWLNNKKNIRFLIIILISIVLVFLTFVKYHILCLITIIYVFISLEDRKYIKKGAMLLGILILIFFVSNYYLLFLIRGTSSAIKTSYYFNHLWNYVAGSIIYDNFIFSKGILLDTNILYKLLSFVSSPINLFLNKIFKVSIFKYQILPFYPVGTNGERGNVVDAIGYLYPSNGNIFELLIWGLVLFLFGLLFSYLYKKMYSREKFNLTLSIFLTFFLFYSFFGTFYVNFPPYEILLWSIFIPQLFMNNYDYKEIYNKVKLKVRKVLKNEI